jgi:anti-anti-sigma factor
MAPSLSTAAAPVPVPESAPIAPKLEVSVSEEPGELVIRVGGEAGVAQAGDLADFLLRLGARRAPLVTLDLSRLSVLSCLAVGALVGFRHGVVRAGGNVRLQGCLQERVRESLERTGVTPLFEPADDNAAPGAAPGNSARQSARGGRGMNRSPNVHDLERKHGITWGDLVGMEPRLAELLWQARSAGARCRGWEEVRQAFAPFRNAVAEVVGFQSKHRGHPVLGSVGAYEVAYWRLHDAISGLLPRSGNGCEV